jgi:hypothetical protein
VAPATSSAHAHPTHAEATATMTAPLAFAVASLAFSLGFEAGHGADLHLGQELSVKKGFLTHQGGQRYFPG